MTGSAQLDSWRFAILALVITTTYVSEGLYSETSSVLIKLPGLQREFKHLEINVNARICYLVEICFQVFILLLTDQIISQITIEFDFKWD